MTALAFSSKLEGALYGVAIGDGMGGPVEGWSAGQILERFSDHDFNGFLPVTHDREPTVGKGDGRITDDTNLGTRLPAHEDGNVRLVAPDHHLD